MHVRITDDDTAFSPAWSRCEYAYQINYSYQALETWKLTSNNPQYSSKSFDHTQITMSLLAGNSFNPDNDIPDLSGKVSLERQLHSQH